MNSTLKPLREPGQPNLGQRAADMLRRAIVAGEFPSGTRLIEADLAERLGVSRGPIRDALRQLEAEGLVEFVRRSAFVRLGQRDIWELYSLRSVLEGFALELATQSFTDDDFTAVETILNEMVDAAEKGDQDALLAADMAFHSAFLERVDHRRLLQAWLVLARSIETMLAVTGGANPNVEELVDHHQQILTAVKTRNPAVAQQWLGKHLDIACEIMQKTYQHQ